MGPFTPEVLTARVVGDVGGFSRKENSLSRAKRRRRRRSSAGVESTNVPHHPPSPKPTNRLATQGSDRLQADQTDNAALTAEGRRICQLIAKRDYKSALFQAKRLQKTKPTRESETILISAYVARIKGLLEAGMVAEAKSLTELVKNQYPSFRDRLVEVSWTIVAREGRVDELVGPLNDPTLGPETRTRITETIKREVTDLEALARCGTLAADHPIRQDASAVITALKAVACGPVRDDQIALDRISRRSPFAAWKMLIRAIAAFYRKDDEACLKYMNVIDADSPPARVVPALRAMLSQKVDEPLKGTASALAQRVNTCDKGLREVMQRLDHALARRHRSKCCRGIERAVRECRRARPDLVDKLKKHISIRGLIADLPPDRVRAAMGGSPPCDAYFWRLFARGSEIREDTFTACSLWEEFRRYAIHEGWFAAGGAEEATLYLHMADLLRGIPPKELTRVRRDFIDAFEGYGAYYADQAKSIQAAAPKDGKVDVYFLYPERLYERACTCQPEPETYHQWLECVETAPGKGKAGDAVASAWHAAAPEDSRPLLHLMASAEKRNALKMAMKYLEKAEAIDGVNSQVRRARLRLWVATAVRHLKQRKVHLAEKDFQEIAALDQVREGDRLAFLAAMRWVGAVIGNAQEDIARWGGQVSELMGVLAAEVVLTGVARACGVKSKDLPALGPGPALLKPGELAEAVARGCAVGDDMDLSFDIPRKWLKFLMEDVSGDQCTLDGPQLRTLAEAALRIGHPNLAYAACGAGLKQDGPGKARFLLLRGRSLPRWAPFRRRECMIAAVELARRGREMDLVDEAVDLLRKGGSRGWAFAPFGSAGESRFKMDPDKVEAVLAREKQAREFPKYLQDSSLEADYVEEDSCQCPDCRRRRRRLGPYDGAPFLEDDDDEDDSKDVFGPGPLDPDDMPREVLDVMLELTLKTGGRLDSEKDFEKAARKYPKLFKRLEKAFLEFVGSGDGLPAFGFGGGRKTRRKKRRRRRL